MQEVVVGREQGQVMTNAKLRQQRVDRAYLNAGPTTGVAQLRGVDVIMPIWADNWQRGKSLDDVLARARAGETLKQLLQNEARRDDHLVTPKGTAQREHLRSGAILVSPESERPDAGVNE